MYIISGKDLLCSNMCVLVHCLVQFVGGIVAGEMFRNRYLVHVLALISVFAMRLGTKAGSKDN